MLKESINIPDLEFPKAAFSYDEALDAEMEKIKKENPNLTPEEVFNKARLSLHLDNLAE